jgi:hypothetical protein
MLVIQALRACAENILDGGLVMYCGLFVLFIWRGCFGWRCCGKHVAYANYCFLLLFFVFLLMTYDTIEFLRVALSSSGHQAWGQMPGWVRSCVTVTPIVNFITYGVCSYQTFTHVERIKEESAVLRHDRAVMVIMLPIVYSAMAMSSLTELYLFICHAENPFVALTPPAGNTTVREQQALAHMAVSRSKTALLVGDLYEAWALYQFAELIFEVIQAVMTQQSPSIVQAPENSELKITHERLVYSFEATKSLAWLGILTFVAVCVGETGCSLWLLTVSSNSNPSTPEGAENYESAMSQFTLAGFIASGAAVYNVYKVEHTFQDAFLSNFHPTIKFLTIKLLVSLSFFQRGIFNALQAMDKYLPSFLQKIVAHIPFLQQLVEFTPCKFELFYSALVVFECCFICMLHLVAWNSEEAWYEEAGSAEDDRLADLESKALVKDSQGGAYGSGR